MIYLFPVLLLLICLGFWAAQARIRRGRRFFVDLGWVFMALLLIYGIVPGLGFLLAHLGIGKILDPRLSTGLDLAVVEEVQLIFLCFTASFAIAYSCARRFGPKGEGPDPWCFAWQRTAQNGVPDTKAYATQCHRAQALRELPWLIPLAIGLMIALSAVRWLFGADVSDNYVSSYTVFREMPLIVQQLIGVATQTLFSLLVAVIVFAVAAWPTKHFLVAIAIGCWLIYVSLAGGSRSTAFLCFFAYIVAATIYVRHFSIGKVVALGGVALVLFLLAGLLRDQLLGESYFLLLQHSEFTSVFINAIDLKQRLGHGFVTENRLSFYLVDLLRLVPSQLLGSLKVDPATWYVQTFYPERYNLGGGLAFGSIAESAIGFGAPEALIRGALLGLIFAWLANRLTEGPRSVVHTFIYVWLIVLSYQSIRDTTFSLGGRALFHLLPLVVLLVLTRHMRFRRRRKRPNGPEPPKGQA